MKAAPRGKHFAYKIVDRGFGKLYTGYSFRCMENFTIGEVRKEAVIMTMLLIQANVYGVNPVTSSAAWDYPI